MKRLISLLSVVFFVCLIVSCAQKAEDEFAQVEKAIKAKDVSSLPESFNWKDKNIVVESNPKHHGKYCGCCMTFATLDVMAASIRKTCDTNGKLGPKVNLSEAYVLSCSLPKGTASCHGGTLSRLFSWLNSNGVIEQPVYCFPYRSDDPFLDRVSCSNEKSKCTPEELKKIWKIESYGKIDIKGEQCDPNYKGVCPDNPTIERLKQAIYDYGPITMGLYPTYLIKAASKAEEADHIVAVIGWNSKKVTKYGTGVWKCMDNYHDRPKYSDYLWSKPIGKDSCYYIEKCKKYY